MDLGKPIAIGNTAEIYLCVNKIVKLFKSYLSKTEASYEANKQMFAYSCGLKVPKILDVTELNGKQALVMEFIDGQTLGAALDANLDKIEYYLTIFIDVQLKIHHLVTDLPELMSDKLTRKIKSTASLNEGQKSVLIQKSESITYENRLCHGDFHPFNLLMTENEVTIIDWVDATAGDIRADVYRTYLLFSNFSMELADLYLQHYCQRTGLSKVEVFQWAPIIAGARLSENVSVDEEERLLKIVRCSIG